MATGGRRVTVHTPVTTRSIEIHGGYRQRGTDGRVVLVADNGAISHATYIVDAENPTHLHWWAGGLHPRATEAFERTRPGSTFNYRGRRVTKLTDAELVDVLGRRRTLHQVGVAST